MFYFVDKRNIYKTIDTDFWIIENQVFTKQSLCRSILLHFCISPKARVLTIDGNSEMCAHMWSDFDYLICERCLFRYRPAKNRNFFLAPERNVFLYTCATYAELPSNITSRHNAINPS